MQESKQAEIIDLFKSARARRKITASTGINADVQASEHSQVAMNCQTHVHVYGFDPTRDHLSVDARNCITIGDASRWWLLALGGLLLLAATVTIATTVGFIGTQPPANSVTQCMGD